MFLKSLNSDSGWLRRLRKTDSNISQIKKNTTVNQRVNYFDLHPCFFLDFQRDSGLLFLRFCCRESIPIRDCRSKWLDYNPLHAPQAPAKVLQKFYDECVTVSGAELFWGSKKPPLGRGAVFCIFIFLYFSYRLSSSPTLDPDIFIPKLRGEDGKSCPSQSIR